MRVSFWTTTQQPWPDLLERARTAEALGYHGVWVADHFMPSGDAVDAPMLECFGVLGALAVAVPRVRLGSLVAGITYRHPAVLANQAATIDEISGGRVVCGVGAGWQENEHVAYGIELGSIRARIDRFEEACAIIRSLRDNARTTATGDHYLVTDAPMEPKPSGAMPLLIGASGERRMPGVVARFADEWNAWGTPETCAHKRPIFEAACEAIGRDPTTLVRSTQALVLLGPDGAAKAEELAPIRPAIGGTADQLVEVLGGYAEAGIDELIVPDFTLGGQTETLEALEHLARDVVAVAS
ncbi:LLM class flavin-dependent oxidoreductase [soil metagenome]